MSLHGENITKMAVTLRAIREIVQDIKEANKGISLEIKEAFTILADIEDNPPVIRTNMKEFVAMGGYGLDFNEFLDRFQDVLLESCYWDIYKGVINDLRLITEEELEAKLGVQ